MSQSKVRAVYMRGGTSKERVFQEETRLPADKDAPGSASFARDRQSRPVRSADRRHGRRHFQHQQGRYRGPSSHKRLRVMSIIVLDRSRSTGRVVD